MQLSVGSHWIDTQGKQFEITDVENNGVETWVTYTQPGHFIIYRCLAEAFEHRFTYVEPSR